MCGQWMCLQMHLQTEGCLHVAFISLCPSLSPQVRGSEPGVPSAPHYAERKLCGEDQAKD